MLNYATAKYCLLVWDDDRTNADDALMSLQGITGAKGIRTEPHTITFKPFHLDGWNLDDEAKKVLEEAAEIRGELRGERYRIGNDDGAESINDMQEETLLEAFDTMQAAANFIEAYIKERFKSGYCNWQELYEKVVTKNQQRGYYDD